MKELEQNFKKSIGGYLANEEIMREVLQSPDYVYEDGSETLVWGFGTRQSPQDPAFSVYCFAVIHETREVVERGSAGGMSLKDAIKALPKPYLSSLLFEAMRLEHQDSKDTKPSS